MVALCQELGWLLIREKTELDPKQVFNFVGYQFDLREGKVRPTLERWQAITKKIPVCLFWQFMSLIGLLTATEKPRSTPYEANTVALEKVIPIPKSLHPHPKWWLEEDNVLQGQLLHPLKHALQIFTDALKEGWGAHLNTLQGEPGPFLKG